MVNLAGTDDFLETRVKVLTWNIWWQFGPWRERQAAILSTLRRVDADIICLQEVWSDGDNSSAKNFAEALGFHHIFAPDMARKGVGFGNAILSRWPIRDHAITQLSGQQESGESRLALYGDIDGPRGRLPVFCTHLNWKAAQSHIRQQQVADLARFVGDNSSEGFPPIVCGDFNAEPESEEIRMMKGLTTVPVKDLYFVDAWAAAGTSGPGYSWDNRNPYVYLELDPDRRIDYIFVGHPKVNGAGHITSCRLEGNAPVKGIWPSDHHAVLAELRY